MLGISISSTFSLLCLHFSLKAGTTPPHIVRAIRNGIYSKKNKSQQSRNPYASYITNPIVVPTIDAISRVKFSKPLTTSLMGPIVYLPLYLLRRKSMISGMHRLNINGSDIPFRKRPNRMKLGFAGKLKIYDGPRNKNAKKCTMLVTKMQMILPRRFDRKGTVRLTGIATIDRTK